MYSQNFHGHSYQIYSWNSTHKLKFRRLFYAQVSEVWSLRGVILHLGARRSALETDVTRVQGRIGLLSEQYNELTGLCQRWLSIFSLIWWRPCVEQFILRAYRTPPRQSVAVNHLDTCFKGLEAHRAPHLCPSLHLLTLFFQSAEPHNSSYRRAFPLIFSLTGLGTNHTERDCLFSEIMRHSSSRASRAPCNLCIS